MPHHPPTPIDAALTRRELLRRSGMGLGSLALGTLLSEAGGLARAATGSTTTPLARTAAALRAQGQAGHPPVHERRAVAGRHVRPQARADEVRGQAAPDANLRTERKTGAAFGSPFKFKKYGQSGIEVSELFAHDGRARRRHLRDPLDARRRAEPRAVADADELRRRPPGRGRASGSWVTLRPGHREPEPARLHRHVPRRLSDRRVAELAGRASCRASTRARTSTPSTPTIEKLIENIRNTTSSRPRSSAASSTSLRELNARHLRSAASATPQLEARIQSFELAYRMQTEAADAFDVSREPQHIRELYGPGVHARQLLIARRLLERGVRFVQVWHGDGQPWDNHDDIESEPPQAGRRVRPGRSPPCSPTSSSAGCSTTRWSSGAASSAARRPSSCPRRAPTPAR